MAGSDALLFGPLDTPGPVYHTPVTGLIYQQVNKQVTAEGIAKNGLYLRTTAPVVSLQTAALLLPAGMSWGGLNSGPK